MNTNSTNNEETSINQNTEANSTLNLPSNDFRIEIHAPRADMNLSGQGRLAGTMQQNISTLLHQARNQFEQDSDSRMWRVNFSNVFQGVRPFVQRSFSTSYQYTPLPNVTSYSVRSAPVGAIDSQNLENNNNNENGINSSLHGIRISNNINNTMSPSPSTSSTLQRPFFERVAALTRNDPPDPIETGSTTSSQRNSSPSSSNRNHQQNNVNTDEGAVAEVFAQIPEARRAFDTFYRYLPLISILLAKSAYDHIRALTDFAVLIVLFMHSNNLVKEQVSKQTQRNVFLLVREVVFILTIIFLKFYVINQTNPINNLTRPITMKIVLEYLTLSRLLYYVAISDFFIKLVTIIIKMFIIMLPPSVIKYKGRGRYFVLIEALSQVYRSLAPMQLWFFFLLLSYSGMEKILGIIFLIVYFVAKAFDLIDRIKICKKAFFDFFRQVNYGKVPTEVEMQIAGEQCPICHDKYDTPVKLECSHIFCEMCVGTWFTREKTCPLCRAQIAEDPSWQDGSTSYFLQLY